MSVNSAALAAETRDFYSGLLGPPAPRPRVDGVEGTWLAAGLLHLVETPGDGPLGLHWCFGVTSLAAARDVLTDRGIGFVTGSQSWPDGRVVEQLWFSDPTGAVVELQQDPGGEAFPADLAG